VPREYAPALNTRATGFQPGEVAFTTAPVPEGHPALGGVADHDVVQHLDAQELTTGNDTACESQVLGGGLGLEARRADELTRGPDGQLAGDVGRPSLGGKRERYFERPNLAFQ
jgi:hypothetical protein